MLKYAEVYELGMSPGDNAEKYIGIASALVRQATRAAVYATDLTGLPGELSVIEAFRDATIAQVNAMIEAEASESDDSEQQVASSSFGGASITYVVSSTVATLGDLKRSLCSEAWVILANEGLINGTPSLF